MDNKEKFQLGNPQKKKVRTGTPFQTKVRYSD